MPVHSRAALAAFVLIAAATPTAQAQQSVLAQSRRQTFVVQVCTNAHHAAAIGSGVVVARDGDVLTIATAEHVIAHRGTLRIVDTSRHAFYRVLNTHVVGDYDLALIRVRAQPEFPVAPVTAAQPVAGEPVFVWGNTGNGFWELATGRVLQTAAQIPGVSGSPRITIACAACSHGDSGSGVFDAQGRLLGVLTRAWSKAGGPVLFIEVEPAALVSQEVLATR